MFAKGARFPPEKPSEAPGPGHYKLPEDRLENYKKGAFLEKTDRFGIEKDSGVPGPGTYNTAPRDSNSRPGPSKPQPPNPGLTHLQQQIDTLKSQNARLEKEHQQAIRKYEDKLAHTESTVKSLVKDNVALQSQVSSQQKEHRLVCQRELALRTALEKSEATHKGEADRAKQLAGLQRKLQELEKVHVDDKKKHQAGADQLRNELDSSRKAFTEQCEQLSAIRTQHELGEARMKDLKKAIIADQAEIKELRTKVRDADQTKNRETSRQGEVDTLKKAMHNMEVKHKTELRDRDAKIAEHGRVVSTERRRREALELQARTDRSKADAEVKETKDRARRLEDELATLKGSAEEAQSAASEERVHLSNLRATMARVVEEYGRLASSSTPLATYRQTQLQCTSLQLRNLRLERRLADRDLLVEQLTDFCRQASEEKAFFARVLHEAEQDNSAILNNRTFDNDTRPEDDLLFHSLLLASEEARRGHDILVQSDLESAHAMSNFYQAGFEDLLVSYAVAHRESVEQSAIVARLDNLHSQLQAEVDALRLEHRTAESELSKKCIQIAGATAREQVLNERLAGQKSEMVKLEEALRKERESNGRLVHAAHQNKMNEQVLRLEIDELVEDLADATRYKEAHADLLREAIELIQRNELAEAEAEHLSKCNAEILGHTNPQQKIFYVDRIRRDLADTKHQLLQSTRDRENLAANNAALQHEVAAYKSVAVPLDLKPRSNRVRVERTPLASRSVNELTRSTSITFELTPPPDEEIIDAAPMTLEEIM